MNNLVSVHAESDGVNCQSNVSGVFQGALETASWLLNGLFRNLSPTADPLAVLVCCFGRCVHFCQTGKSVCGQTCGWCQRVCEVRSHFFSCIWVTAVSLLDTHTHTHDATSPNLLRCLTTHMEPPTNPATCRPVWQSLPTRLMSDKTHNELKWPLRWSNASFTHLFTTFITPKKCIQHHATMICTSKVYF